VVKSKIEYTGGLVDFCRPAVSLNLKQPAEILPKKKQKQATTFRNSRIAGKNTSFLKLKLNCSSTAS
jgi:hypothetical protein